MNQQRFIPYPNSVARFLLRLPILFYRLGLGDLMNAAHILILSTRGRSTGMTRYTPIEYRRHGSQIYIVSAWGERPQWLQNLKAQPEVIVQQGTRRVGARAEVVTNSGEALRVLHLFRRRAPMIYDALIARLSDRERVTERTLPEASREITIVRIDPMLDTPDLRPLPANFAWATILALGMMLALAISLTRSRD